MLAWRALLLCCLVAGCYAIPSEHDIAPVAPADADTTPDAEGAEEDADLGPDADADADVGGDPDAASPNDAGMDARADTGAMDSASDSEAGPVDGGRDADASPCGTCSDASPLCGPSGQCVQCTSDDAGCATGEFCTAAGRCVACRENQHCTSADASVCAVATGTCTACAEGNDSQQCAHIPGKGVCAAGECVQCTSAKREACKTPGNQPAVCDTLKRTCTTKGVGSANACDECVSDPQCAPNHLCVMTKFGQEDVGYFCQPTQRGSCTDKRPYAKEVNDGRSIDGASDIYCTLSRTTCPAIVPRGTGYKTSCGVTANGTPTSTNPVRGDNALCGVAGLNDGFCVSPGAGQYVCTVLCTPQSEPANGYLARDCPDLEGPDPICTPQAHATGNTLLCSAD